VGRPGERIPNFVVPVPGGGQAEMAIAVDTSGQHIVVGFNDTRGFALTPVSVSGFAYSDDGGLTFTDGGQLPTNAGTVPTGSGLPQVFGDPDVKYIPGGGGCNAAASYKLFDCREPVRDALLLRSLRCVCCYPRDVDGRARRPCCEF